MATLTFTPTSTATALGRDWNNPANWGGTVPTAADTAVVATPAAAAPVIFGGTVDTVGDLTLSAPAAGAGTSNLFIGGADYIGTVAPTSAGPGTLEVAGTITDTAGFVAVNTGSRLTAGDIDLGALADLGGGGTIAAAGSIVNGGVILANAADVSLATPLVLSAGAITGAGSIEVRSGSSLDLATSTASTQTVHVAPGAAGTAAPATLILESAFAGTLAADPGTKLDLVLPPGATGASISGTTLTIGGATPETITLGGPGYSGTLTSPTVPGGRATFALSPVCFARGTRIATEAGEVAVEDLRAGDVVRLAGGGTAPVVWVGRRALDCARHPEPRQVWPVRVRAGAFGPGLPSRDLCLSPQHAIFDEGVLIPAKFLVNGSSVVQEPCARITYYHVELERHDLLLAEGLAVESYLDTGDRASFENGGAALVLHPDFARLVWDGRACAELKVTGPELEAVRAKLARNAGAGPAERRATG